VYSRRTSDASEDARFWFCPNLIKISQISHQL